MPVINVVMLTCNRYKLTNQALHTLFNTTANSFNLTVVDDGSGIETLDMLAGYARWHGPQMQVIAEVLSNHVTGKLKNFAVAQCERVYGRGDYLYISDNDAFFTPGWDEVLIEAYRQNRHERFLLIGGSNHPFHQPEGKIHYAGPGHQLREYGALAGTSHFMKWSTWDCFGPYSETGAPGPCQSEDHALCQKIREAGGRVGAVWPEVVYDCGIMQTGGTESPGALYKRRYEGVIYE